VGDDGATVAEQFAPSSKTMTPLHSAPHITRLTGGRRIIGPP
jgi:hypothetical protein